MKKYRIIAYGPEKSRLVWDRISNLETIKEYLRLEGYDTIKVKEEE